MASRAIGRGLAKIEPSSPNTIIAFAAKAGSTASDGDSKNSPFATAVVEHLPKPGLDLRRAFGFVRDDVLKNTGNKQEPFLYGSLGGNDVPLVSAKPAATGPQADPQASVRRDYELSLQLGTRDGWEAFLRTYPEGFYADLAKGQLKKIAAEETRVFAVEKAKVAEQEKARLAAEGAQQAEQAKAAASAKAAEQARTVAEKAKQLELDKASAAEKARQAEQEKVRLAAEKAKQAEQDKIANAEQARLVAEKAASEKKQLAAVSLADNLEQPAVDLPRALQAELRRVGCSTGTIDGNWNASSQKALDLFNKHAGLKIDLKTANVDALDAVKAKQTRVCPLICDHGFNADGDRCTKIACRAGYEVGDDNTCEKIEVKKPTAKRDEPRREKQERTKVDVAPQKPQASGQILCTQQGCRPVQKGCRIEARASSSGGGNGYEKEVCN